MIAYLQGGLGNQMFQYAAGLGAAKKLRCELIINNSFYKDHKQRQYELGVFPISAQTWGNVTGEPIKEKHFEYQEITTNGMMVGYWQSERYFENVADQIRLEFRLPKHSIGKDMVAVSVRRGDYLHLPDVFYSLGEDYYSDAREVFPDSIFVVFSDDPEWVKDNLKWADIIIEDNPAIVDLALLSCFKNHIIANSSFSWWGAWLANGDTVVAPRNWFTCDYNTKDLIPDRWIRV